MQYLINSEMIKELLLLLHLVGVAFGVGGAWILDALLIFHLKKNIITKDKLHFINFTSKIVLIGLSVLWVSGLSFLIHYFLFSPENLTNQKVWAKVFIVFTLTVNGYFIHKKMLSALNEISGKTILDLFSLPQKIA